MFMEVGGGGRQLGGWRKRFIHREGGGWEGGCDFTESMEADLPKSAGTSFDPWS